MRSRLLCTLSILVLSGAFATGCGGSKKTADVQASPYSSGNYPGILKIGNPYDIAGRTYYPAYDPSYVEEGVASWYGPGFHGRSTANGERFDQNALTAAHRTLPMPSIVRVTNLENGRSAVLKVNDRGPFAKDRIIDLSKKSAEELGVISKGTARVRVEYMQAETRALIADLMRNNQIKADEATLAMLAMNDLAYGAPEPAATSAPTGLGIISSANASETVHASVQRGVVDRAPLSPVSSRALDTPEGAANTVTVEETIEIARIERPAAASAAPVEYDTGGTVGRTMPEESLRLEVPPVGAIPAVTPDAIPDAAVAAPASQPMELQPLPESVNAAENTVTAQAGVSAPSFAGEETAMTATTRANTSGIFIQAGAFSQEQNALDLSRRLATLGRSSVKPVDIAGKTWYRVRLGPLSTIHAANAALHDVRGLGLPDAHVVRD